MFNLQKLRFSSKLYYDFADNKVKLTIGSKVFDMDNAALLVKDHLLNLMRMKLLSRKDVDKLLHTKLPVV